MVIATWNVERLKHKADLNKMLSICKDMAADILVLTEADTRLAPEYKNAFHSAILPADYYRGTERRVSIYTNYECVGRYDTYDKDTALCVELATERGNLIVYGTIIGVYGNRRESFKTDLLAQAEDYKRLAATGKSLCVCGDYNCSFSDNYYFTNFGRDTIRAALDSANMQLLTADVPECVDHIALSKAFLSSESPMIQEWNMDKALSDHKGISVEI